MGFKIVKILFFIISSSALAHESKQYSANEYFKNYALSTCISDGFKAAEVRADAAATARGYLELGDFPLEAHTEATLLGRQYLKKEYKSHSGSNLILMKCIDFYHSIELQEIAKRYNNELSRLEK